MKEYIAKKVSYKLKIDDDAWDKVPAAELNEGWWEAFPKKYATSARLVHCDGALILRMESEEWPVRIETMEMNSEVCFDSCLEFFFTANTEDKAYINIEASAGSVPLCYIGNERNGREPIDPIAEGLEFRTLLEYGKGWKLYVFIPLTFMEKYFSRVDGEMRANFYKCGEQTIVEHYLVWNKVETAEPDYHRPEYFGKLVLSDELI